MLLLLFFFFHNWLVIYEENINICLPSICKSGADLLSFTGVTSSFVSFRLLKYSLKICVNDSST